MASANLPKSLVEDILSRLPVKSLKRFTLDLNRETPFFNDDMQELNILGACINGVICLYDRPFLISNQHPNDDLYRIALWNPEIREFKVLPTRHVHCPSHVDHTYEGFGFGYDHKSNDYKVVRIVSFWDDSIVGPDRSPLVEVYTLSTDSWRQIDTVLDASILSDPCKSEIYLNGAYHCAEETVTAKNFDIWMMYEYGVKESWIKQFVVLYNFGSGETKNLDVRGLPDSFHALQTMTYVESLVSITNRIVFQN
ncbi:F-box/kelch-repeat protein At3g23880-like [Quercus lobata]|uniref:F-box/kelch-repeat protein At3g23880-like n=1 Tax=Quercus lobata TaxID=97700 RepID=UPI001244F2F7|nr:F-box/kelch-repeat protein At3g23880-like [Quercus lobata]